MRQLQGLLAALCLLIVLEGCSNRQPDSTKQMATFENIANTDWYWIGEFINDDLVIHPQQSGEYLLHFDNETSFRFVSDCNTGVGGLLIEQQEMTLAHMMSTRMACGPSSVDRRFVHLLKRVTRWQLDANTLILEIDKSQKLRFARF